MVPFSQKIFCADYLSCSVSVTLLEQLICQEYINTLECMHTYCSFINFPYVKKILWWILPLTMREL